MYYILFLLLDYIYICIYIRQWSAQLASSITINPMAGYTGPINGVQARVTTADLSETGSNGYKGIFHALLICR